MESTSGVGEQTGDPVVRDPVAPGQEGELHQEPEPDDRPTEIFHQPSRSAGRTAGGQHVVVLESSPPKRNLLQPFIKIHLNYVIPTLGRLITGEADAYRYLPSTTQRFQNPDALAATMRDLGFVNVHYKLFMFGTIAIHVGQKPS